MSAPKFTDDRKPRMRSYTRADGSKGGPIFWHPCSICGNIDAAYGFGVDMRRDKFGTWYCKEHVPKNEQSASQHA